MYTVSIYIYSMCVCVCAMFFGDMYTNTKDMQGNCPTLATKRAPSGLRDGGLNLPKLDVVSEMDCELQYIIGPERADWCSFCGCM